MTIQNRNLLIGFLTVIGIIASIVFMTNSGKNVSQKHTYNAVFRTVEGIKIGAPVYVFGVQVGRVSNMQLSDAQAQVTIVVDANVEIPVDSSLEVQTMGLFAEKSMIILLGFEGDMLQDKADFMYTGNAVNVLGLLNEQLDRNIEKREAEKQ